MRPKVVIGLQFNAFVYGQVDRQGADMKAAIGSAFVVAALVAGTAPVHAAAAQTAVASADHNLDQRIEKRIDASTLKKYDLKVSVTDGVATLTGIVPTEADRQKATQLATVPGIARVENQLIVDLSAMPPRGTTGTVKGKAAEAAAATKSGADKVAGKTKDGLSKSGEVITDAWITTRVHSKFVGEDLLKGSDINVDTKDHVVTLNGTVMSAAARARAVAEAKEVEGVQRVIDRLTIGPKK
jgi:osmotically-inducible protein OsmY